MERIIARAGHQQWPSLFQNLRKSRVTKLLEEGRSPQSIATLLGHSIQVMMKHYLIATDRDFQAALEEPGRGAWSAEGTKLW
jgi:integrase